ncbi:MAG: DUF4270 family protein [Taibaiella sp.]|nr:DUF4270 family protein [Taibaiella sp.]
MRYLARHLAIISSAAITIFSQSGCKENTIINANIAPNINGINTIGIDTFTAISTTLFFNQFPVSNNANLGVGNIYADPFFGNTTSTMYFQVVPQILNPSFFATDIVDSAFLILPYTGFTFGDNSTASPAQKIDVYPITDSLSSTTNYFSDRAFAIDKSSSYGSITLSPSSLADSIFAGGKLRSSILKIPLNNTFINKIKTPSVYSSADNITFLSNFKGLCILGDSTIHGKSLSYFYFGGSDTFTRPNILVYHHNPTSSPGTENLFQIYYNSTYCAKSAYITRNYAGYPANNYFHPTKTNDSIALIEGHPGAGMDIHFPYLYKSLPTAIINKAELIVTQVSFASSPIYAVPTGLALYKYNQAGDSLANITDRYPIGSLYSNAYIDGNAQSVNLGGVTLTRYVMNIPREVQLSITQQSDLRLFILGSFAYPGAGRLVAGGGSITDKNFRVRLNIVYSKK